MGFHVARLESPFTAQPASVPPLGYAFRPDDENLRRWRDWWRVANQEHFIFFFLLGFGVIVALSVLAAESVLGQQVGTGLDFIRVEGEALGQRIGPWFRTVFWLTGTVLLFSTNLGILDHVGRLIADILKMNWLRESVSWSESSLYLVIVWTEIVIGSAIILFAIDAPMVLLVIAASLNGIVMLVYCVLLVQLNRTALPHHIKIRGLRLAAMAWAVALFGYFSVFVVWQDVVPSFSRFGGGG